MYTLNAEHFVLNLTVVTFEKDLSFPINTYLSVHVESDGFCADLNMDVDHKRLIQFAGSLKQLYDTLSGTAVLEEPYGMHNSILFSAQRGGHIRVQGNLYKTNVGWSDQELRFVNQFDQTYLKPFVDALQGVGINGTL